MRLGCWRLVLIPSLFEMLCDRGPALLDSLPTEQTDRSCTSVCAFTNTAGDWYVFIGAYALLNAGTPISMRVRGAEAPANSSLL